MILSTLLDALNEIANPALAQNWDARLLRRYPDTTGGDALPLAINNVGTQLEKP